MRKRVKRIRRKATDWEKIFAKDTFDKGLLSKIYKEPLRLNNKKTNNPILKMGQWGFPGGAAVKNPPANAGDTGSSPGPGRSHMPRSNYARAPQLLSLCSRAHEPQLLSLRATTNEARAPRACAPQQEKSPQ